MSTKRGFSGLDYVSDTHALCTHEILIDEMGLSDMLVKAAHAAELAKEKVEGDISTTVGILLAKSRNPHFCAGVNHDKSEVLGSLRQFANNRYPEHTPKMEARNRHNIYAFNRFSATLCRFWYVCVI